MTRDSLEDARHRILAENTAQAVFKHLERLQDYREAFGARWVWELLQNARDAATGAGVSIEIDLTQDGLSFRHDGRPFNEAEIAHLIYHGSTKVEANDQDLVHFGSGFLSTHLLSRLVNVAGRLRSEDDLKTFSFVLDRSGDTPDRLNQSMESTWEAFSQSLLPGEEVLAGGPTTSYTYPLDDRAQALAHAGVNHLRKCAPLVFAFAPEITELNVTTDAGRWGLTRGELRHEDGIALLHLKVTSDDDVDGERLVAVAGDGDVSAAIPLQVQGNEIAIDLDDELPRLFVVFPLLTTERLALPAVVNSKGFTPREDRDGVLLNGASERVRENKRILEVSAPYVDALVDRAARNCWRGIEDIVSYDTTVLPDWVDPAWFRGHLARHLEHTRRAPLLTSLSGDRVAPLDAWIPAAKSAESLDCLWQLTAAWTGAGDRLPVREKAAVWSKNVDHWKQLSDDKVTPPSESFPLRSLAALVDSAGTTSQLDERLAECETAVAWLRTLADLVYDENDSDLFDKYALLPSQAGRLHKRAELHIDKAIPEDLKQIASSLGCDLFDRLLDKDLATAEMGARLSSKNEAEALDEVLAAHATLCENESLPVALGASNAALFWWLAGCAEHSHRLDGFPVITADEHEDAVRVLTLRARPGSAPLAPPDIWPDAARGYSDLFPRRRMLSDLLVEGGTPELWRALGTQHLVALDPLLRRFRKLETFLSSSTTVDSDDDGSHQTVEEVEVSDIAFLEEADVGLIDVARRSKPRAIELVRFLLEYVIEADELAFREEPLDCDCGEMHKAFGAAWLVPLRRRKWLPIDSRSGRAARVSAEHLASLLRNEEELVRSLASDRGDQLLRSLGVSPSDFQLRAVAADEDTRKAYVVSIGDMARATGGIERLQAIAREMRDHPEIISQIEAQRDQRAKVERNSRIGQLVEELLREELSSFGLSVRRTGVGSDFEIESDFVVGGEEVILEISSGEHQSILLEVKSARSDSVRMTPRQAEEATRHPERFALCVVSLPDEDPTQAIVRENSRFVFDIGGRLAPSWDEYRAYRNSTDDVRKLRGPVGVEIFEGQVRFRVDREIWQAGDALQDAVAAFQHRS